MVSSAPAEVRYCPRCGAAMSTAEVHGTPRRVCRGCGHVHFTDPKVAVGVLCVRAEKVLLVRRAMDPERGRWALPAGFLDHGEDARVAAAREVAEETGVSVAIGAVLDVFGTTPLFLLFAGRWLAGEPVAGDDADDAGFFGRDELPDLAFESTLVGVRRWVAGPGPPGVVFPAEG